MRNGDNKKNGTDTAPCGVEKPHATTNPAHGHNGWTTEQRGEMRAVASLELEKGHGKKFGPGKRKKSEHTCHHERRKRRQERAQERLKPGYRKGTHSKDT